MLDKEAILRKVNETSIDELQDMICKALDDSGIEYSTDPSVKGMTLDEFFKGPNFADMIADFHTIVPAEGGIEF